MADLENGLWHTPESAAPFCRSNGVQKSTYLDDCAVESGVKGRQQVRYGVLLDHLHPHLDCGEERVRGSQQVRVGLFRASSGFRICLGSLGLLRVPLCLNAIYGCLGFVSVV